MIKSLACALLLLLTPSLAKVTSETPEDRELGLRSYGSRRFSKGRGFGSFRGDSKDVTLKITNLTFQQPFGPFFVMVHNDEVEPIFTLGDPSTEALAILAENGSPADLIELYTDMNGVMTATVHDEDAPFFGGDTTEIDVTVDRDFKYVTIASMAINTNDCFVALNSVNIYDKDVFYSPGYDSGSEENNEACDSIPGPGCPEGSGNERSGNGEGFVHVHRGFFGLTSDLSEQGYDWRNPMLRVDVD